MINYLLINHCYSNSKKKFEIICVKFVVALPFTICVKSIFLTFSYQNTRQQRFLGLYLLNSQKKKNKEKI